MAPSGNFLSGSAEPGGPGAPRALADLVKDRVSALPWQQQADAFALAFGKHPRPLRATMTGGPTVPVQEVPARVASAVSKAVDDGRFAVAALVLEVLGVGLAALSTAPDTLVEIGRRIARDTSGQLDDLVLEVSDGRDLGGQIPANVGLTTPGATAPKGLSPYAKHALARAVDDAAQNWPGWVDDFEQREIELVFPMADESEPWIEAGADEVVHDALMAEMEDEAVHDAVVADIEDEAVQDAILADLGLDGGDEDDIDGEGDSGVAVPEASSQGSNEATLGVAEENDDDFVSMFDLLRKPLPPRDYVLEPFAERGRVSLLIGEPGCNKTTLMAHLGLAVAVGKDWGPFKAKAPGKVLWVNGEETQDETSRRWRGAAKARSGDNHAAVQQSFRRVRAWKRGGAIRIAERGPEGIKLAPRGAQLASQIKRFQPDLVIIDPLATAHTLDESSNADMADFFAVLQDLARENNAAIVVVHHARKGSGKGIEGGMDQARGASAIAGAVRSMWLIRRMDRLHVALECVKANNFLIPEGAQRFELVSVTISNGDSVGTRPPTAAGAEAPETAARGPRRRRATAAQP
jgi:hypothetical protein